MRPSDKADTPWTAWTIVTIGAVLLAGTVGGALYFLFQVPISSILAVAIGLLIIGLAVGRFFAVARCEIL